MLIRRAKPELSTFYIPLIECRTNLCEVQAVGYGDSAQTTWFNATADITDPPWFEFSDMSQSARNIAPDVDVLGIVVILMRNAP